MPDPRTNFSRRQFLEFGALAVSASFCPKILRADESENIACDLLIHGGELLDPSSGLRGRYDVAINQGRIAVVAPELGGVTTTRTIDAAGRLVVPGLIDLHAHVGQPDASLGLVVDDLTARTGVTTCVSAGDVGCDDFADFRRDTLESAWTRVFAFLHIARHGLQRFPDPEMLDLANVDVERAADIVAQNADLLLGIKVRETRAVVGSNGFEPLRLAIAAAEKAGNGARVMCHIGDAPGDLADLLDLLRPGDIVTHTYSGNGNNIVRDGRVLPAALAAKSRGVLFDVGHGGGSFDFTIAEPAIAQGLIPDTISSDLHHASIDTPGKPFLPWVMSKFLHLGFSLEDVVAMTTSRPAQIINRIPGLGTLRVGAPADVTILEEVEGPTEFWDTREQMRTGDRFLRPHAVVRDGRILVGPTDVTSLA